MWFKWWGASLFEVEGAAGDAELVEDAEFAPDGFSGLFSGDGAGVAIEESFDFARVFAEEFDAEVAEAEFQHAGDVFGGGLSHRVVEGIAAADVGEEGVKFATTVAEFDLMMFAGAAAIAVVLAVREGGGEDAVFHVEHGHVLVDDLLEPCGGEPLEQGLELFPVEVVAGDLTGEALSVEEGGGEFVGDVEGIVADELDFGVVLFEVGEAGEVADEDDVGGVTGDLAHPTFFEGFGDADGGEADADGGFAGQLHGGFVAADVFEIAIDGGGAGEVVRGGPVEEALKLFEAADEDIELRFGDGCGDLNRGNFGAEFGKGVEVDGAGADGVGGFRSLQLFEGLAAEVVEDAFGDHRGEGFAVGAVDEGDVAEFVGGIAEAAELFAKGGAGEGMLLGEL